MEVASKCFIKTELIKNNDFVESIQILSTL